MAHIIAWDRTRVSVCGVVPRLPLQCPYCRPAHMIPPALWRGHCCTINSIDVHSADTTILVSRLPQMLPFYAVGRLQNGTRRRFCPCCFCEKSGSNSQFFPPSFYFFVYEGVYEFAKVPTDFACSWYLYTSVANFPTNSPVEGAM